MKRILIFAPNAGISLSTGGGTNFVLRQAQFLAALGNNVTIAGFHSLTLTELQEIHGVTVTGREGVTDVALESGPFRVSFNAIRQTIFRMPAYLMLGDPRFSRWVRRVIRKVRPELVWFHDDIPKAALKLIESSATMLYVHYPLQARNGTDSSHSDGALNSVGEIGQRSLNRVLTTLIDTDAGAHCRRIWANSSITQAAIRKIWHREADVVPPYVCNHPPYVRGAVTKRKVVLSVGVFSPNKNFEFLTEAFGLLGRGDWELILAGHRRDSGYLEKVEKLATSNGRARIVLDASRENILEMARFSRVIAHPAWFEPFGMSIIDGMALGCVPIVLKSPRSGGWVDILQYGKYGLGFETASGFARYLETVSADELEDWAMIAASRAQEYTAETLIERLSRTVND